MSDVDLNLFRVFEAVHRLQSQTRAAAELHLTQPAVSNALTRLRDQVGDRLFEREGHRMVPTAVARAIAPGISQAIALLETSLAATKRFDPNTSARRFRIGAEDALEQAMVPPIFAEVRRQAPGVCLDSVPSAPEEVPTLLTNGELDIALAVVVPHDKSIRHELIARDEIHVAMRKGHPLADSALTIEAWLALDHLVVTGQTRGPTPEDLGIQRLGLVRRVVVRCQTYQAAGRLLAQSDLISIVPAYFASQFRKEGSLVVKSFLMPTPPLEIALYWAASADREPGNLWLRGVVHECIQREVAEKLAVDAGS